MPNVAVCVLSRSVSTSEKLEVEHPPTHARVSVLVMVPKSEYRYSPRTIQLLDRMASKPPPIA